MSELRDAVLSLLADTGVSDITEPRRLGGGSSQENWAFDALTGATHGQVSTPLLLRREPERGVVETDRRAEFALLRVLSKTDLPVAGVHAYDDGRFMGRPSMIVSRLSGRAHRGALKDADPLGLGEETRCRIARMLPMLLSGIHCVDVEGLGVVDILPHPTNNPARRELEHWVAELDAVQLEPHPALRAVIGWLERHLPDPPERVSLVHGDFRPANVLIDGDRISAILDWELAHLGDAHDDLGWYTNSIYRGEHFLRDRWGVDDFLRTWSAATGLTLEPERLHFWQVMSVFRLAVIALTGIRAFCDRATDRPAAPATKVIAAALSETRMMASPTTEDS
jgi:aminoglycoside phosphotransferase (APT) family kinase protein